MYMITEIHEQKKKLSNTKTQIMQNIRRKSAIVPYDELVSIQTNYLLSSFDSVFRGVGGFSVILEPWNCSAKWTTRFDCASDMEVVPGWSSDREFR